jgi:hypothetical protein
LPPKIKFRNLEALKIDTSKKLIYGEHSFRMAYDKLIIASGLEPDYNSVEGLLYALNDGKNNVFSAYHFDKAVSKMAIFTHCMKNKLSKYQNLTKNDMNFIETGNGYVIYSCLDNRINNNIYNNNKYHNNDIIDDSNFDSEIKKDNYNSSSFNKDNNNKGKEKNNFLANKINNYNLIDEFFTNFVETANNIILFYDVIKKSRRKDLREAYMNNIDFKLTIPYNESFFNENISLKTSDFEEEDEMEENEEINKNNKKKDIKKDKKKNKVKDNDKEEFFDINKIILKDFLLNELTKRNIKILWNHKLKKISLENSLIFECENENENKDTDIENNDNYNKNNFKLFDYDFCYISPNLKIPNIMRYGFLFSNNENDDINKNNNQNIENKYKDNINIKKKLNNTDKDNDNNFETKRFIFNENLKLDEYLNYSNFQLKHFDDIFIIGDTLNGFYDRQYHNVFLQADILAHNLKVDYNNRNKIFLTKYIANKSIFLDYDIKNYLIIKNGKLKLLKKSFWLKYLVNNFFKNPGSRLMEDFLLKKRLGVELIKNDYK